VWLILLIVGFLQPARPGLVTGVHLKIFANHSFAGYGTLELVEKLRGLYADRDFSYILLYLKGLVIGYQLRQVGWVLFVLPPWRSTRAAFHWTGQY
jgi:hypothetical protein